MSMSRSGVTRVEAPMDATHTNDAGVPTNVWAGYYQEITDQLDKLTKTVGRGVTDGSEATAGDVGEYLTASATSVALVTNTTETVATLTLSAGDWDVVGGVTFTISSAASSIYAAGIDGVWGSEIIATIPTGSGTWSLVAGAPVRRNVTASTAVTLTAMARFTSGSVSAAGTLSARRMR